MDRSFKHALRLAFEPPPPTKQAEFLSSLQAPKLTYRDFFLGQIGYIRKRVWCCSAAVGVAIVSLALLGGRASLWNDGYTLAWMASALLPFLALLTVTELSRSASFGMAELEHSCRYNLTHIVMARSAILGVSNLMLLLILALAIGARTETPALSVGLYLLVPYLLTCAVSIFALNHITGSESIYCCAVIACAVSLGDGILRVSRQILFTEQYLWAWYGLCLVSFFLLLGQAGKFIRATEEFKWNLLSTD